MCVCGGGHDRFLSLHRVYIMEKKNFPPFPIILELGSTDEVDGQLNEQDRKEVFLY